MSGDRTTLDETLDELIALARNHIMTPAERREQVISFVYGNLPVESRVTREEIEQMFDELYGKPAP